MCIDDAVVVDSNRSENVVTNDGTTMRIMAQKSATPSAWTRQKEVLVESPATAVLAANAEKAKDEVKVIKEQLEDEGDEETAEPEAEAESEPEATEQKPATEDPEEEPESELKKELEGEPEDSSKETDSVDEVPDADEARTEVEDNKPDSKSTDVEATQKGGESEDADAKPEPEPVVESEAKPAKTRGRATSSSETKPQAVIKPDRATILAKLQAGGKKVTKTTASSDDAVEKPTAEKPSEPQGNDDKIDREAIMANLQANAEQPHDRDNVVANLRANTKKSVKRSLSSDRARQRTAEKSATPLGRTAIRAALTKTKIAATPVQSAHDAAEASRREKEEQELLKEDRAYRRKLELEAREDERTRREEERKEQQAIRTEKRQWDAKRREDARKAIDNAANLKAMSLQDMEKIRAQNQFVERFNGIGEQTTKYEFDATAPRGPSQTVIYTSRFVDRLSDVMDDMSVSGSLSIKAGKIGGSGKGSFVDSDKFKESDLNFYISVKVVNQTINFKDALVFNPLRSVDKENFREVYGDSFISGFLEGGEFNALVSMKILNKAKKTDIQAEAKVALTASAVQVEGEVNVGVARSNIETNTETTIQVSWSGGGHIKPMEQKWDIQSLMDAAARFPDLVAECPQRTYAILTKYDALRSFVARKPASYTALQYENAQIYTSSLLDTFVSYKALYKRLGEQIFQVQGKTMEIQQRSDGDNSVAKTGAKDSDQQKEGGTSRELSKTGTRDPVTGLYQYKEETFLFDATVKGLSDARIAARRQMARIVNEVNEIEKDPKLATDEGHEEPFQASTAFEARLPTVVVPERLRIKTHPLSGKRFMAKTLTEEEQQTAIDEDERIAEGSPLFTENDKLSEEEKAAMQALLATDPMIGENFRVSSAAGDEFQGRPFNNLDYLKRDWEIRSIRAEVAEGALVYLAVSYENGLLVEKGASRDGSRVKKFGPFFAGERINSASIEHGRRVGETHSQVLGLRLFTNRGRGLIARALHSEPGSTPGSTGSEPRKTIVRDGVPYENVSVLYLDVPFNLGSMKGFFGRSDDAPQSSKIWRLGILWCRSRTAEGPGEDTADHFGDTGDVIDSESLQDTQAKLTAAQVKLEALQKALAEKDKQIQQLNRPPPGTPFQSYILQTGTALHETDDTFDFVMGDWNQDGHLDLIAIKKSKTGSNSTEVHILSGASNFKDFILHTGTPLPETDDTFDFAIGDWNKDGCLDLIAIKKSKTGSNSTEVHILSGASNFQSYILQTGTALPETDNTFDFAIGDWNKDGRPDLIAIKKSKTGSNSTEVHILSGASNFQSYILQTGTALPETDNTFDFAIGDWNKDGRPDLIAIKKSKTGTSSSEVHILSGASNFQNFIVQTGTPLPETDDSFDFVMGDWSKDGRPDLIAIKTRNTGTSSTEVHILSG
ncbi:uncharacterized protein N7482_010152 [Penicillium canariense]|uniref:Uncharacterized protein n=1 Tax=Penicillium canariense TaxID=189055 RepID=A0A9W9HL81_9EURO|nr:uncharacterized protein N7482_010152 [Penicillium canariense]KAJ5150900.1 hypothetical protein N7482_010152 [Penicillium canariense]